jgi:hypothetical protein
MSTSDEMYTASLSRPMPEGLAVADRLKSHASEGRDGPCLIQQEEGSFDTYIAREAACDGQLART